MKRLSKWILFFIVLLNIAGIIVGCSYRHKPVGWVSIEKPPMRVILVDSQKDVDPKTVYRIMDSMNNMPYKNYKFNEGVGISVDYQGSINHNTSDIKQLKIGE